jgi:hypothetical protein
MVSTSTPGVGIPWYWRWLFVVGTADRREECSRVEAYEEVSDGGKAGADHGNGELDNGPYDDVDVVP